ncbi:MAG TPA: hypothetical protein DDX19_10170 [Rhodopirellula baltica]|nr:hypothetical protein [Rhodopirellula baltica]
MLRSRIEFGPIHRDAKSNHEKPTFHEVGFFRAPTQLRCRWQLFDLFASDEMPSSYLNDP